ncbi:hypothetical protein NTE_01886 [Candidatus Nitrososphaera evergladensis SR1]|uniref:Uncharacterized protein n=1 Tax=Candidatus Nitrososphaera evergladensis SR1 TaxID=1459636 RepID=A0A075MS55_9ARCH|nr:hypothetical protein NTE_01886 [Candidatus Nitrososphaera evergladensis SR1]
MVIAMAKIIGLGKFIVAGVCVAVWLNGFASLYQSWSDAGISAAMWLGGASVCLYWAMRDRRKAKASSQQPLP